MAQRSILIWVQILPRRNWTPRFKRLKRNTKLIFIPQLAQYLLHHGLIVIELKPKCGAINETVFVFKYEEQMDALIKQ